MKKIKLFLPVLLSLVVIFALSLAACKKTDKGNLQSIEITAEPNRTVFMLGEEFSYAGIEVTATYSKSTKILTDEEYVVDASAYNAQKEGTYEIKISYSYNGVTADTSYDVKVSETVYDGLNVTLADGFTLLSNMYLNISDVIVREVDEEGVVIDEPLDRSEYTIEIYLGATKVSYDGGEVAVLSQKGTYQIWAFKDSSLVEGYVLSGFVLITVS